jgi:hypothetical protein
MSREELLAKLLAEGLFKRLDVLEKRNSNEIAELEALKKQSALNEGKNFQTYFL